MKNLLICFIAFGVLFQTKIMASKADSLKNLINTLAVAEQAEIYNQLAKTYLSINLDSAANFSQKAGLLAEKYKQTEQLAYAKKHLGIVNYYRNDTSLAQAYYNDAMQLFEDIGNELEYSNILNNKALIYFDNNKINEAIQLHLQSLRIKERLNKPETIIVSLTNLGNCYNAIGENEKAISYLSRAMEINELIQPNAINSSLILSLGSSYSNMGKFYEALELYNSAIEKANKNADFYNLVSLLNNRGNVLLRLGDIDGAIADYEQAIIQLGKVPRKGQLPSLMLNLGNIYHQTNQYDQAQYYYKKAFNEAAGMNNMQVMARALLNQSLMFDLTKQSDSAYLSIQKALSLDYVSTNPELNTIAINMFGNHLLKAGKYEAAEEALLKAYQLATENNLPIELAKANQALGSLYYSIENYHLAKKHLEESLKLNQESGNLDLQMKNLLSLSQVYEEMADFSEALNYHKQYFVLYDSLFNAEKQEQVTQVEGRLNLRLKEEQLENQRLQLEKKNEELLMQRARISYVIVIALLIIVLVVILYNRKQIKSSRNQLKLEQDQLETEHRLLRAQMNPHFMFNALNSIQAFISENNTMQAEIFLSKFARLMRYYLDSSSKSYVTMEEELAGITLNIELEKLRMNNSFDFEIAIDPAIEAEEVDIPPMLAQPFIENAIKHGLRTKQDQGLLKIQFELYDAHTMKCIIEDNGIGRKAANQSTNKSSTHESKGINITQKRLASIWKNSYKADLLKIIDLSDEKNTPKGTRVEIIYPFKN